MNYLEFSELVQKIELYKSKRFSIDIVPRDKDISWTAFVRMLESKGFVIAATTENFPTGLYIADGLTAEGKLKGWGLEKEIAKEVIVTNIGWPFLSQKPEVPQTDIQGLKVVPHYVMAILFCREGQWAKHLFIPHGSLSVMVADTTGIQYGQSAFEGACAMRNDQGQIFGFRLNKNSARFDKSIRSLDLPGIDIDSIQEAIEDTIKYNSEYVPQDGKLYIRPSVSGLNGGLGIIVPETSVITIEVAAFGNYLPESIRVEGLKYIQRPPSGANKIAPNYGASFRIKHGVKDRGYNDFLSFDEDGNVEEVSTCAVGFIDNEGKFIIPPVQDEIDKKDRHILPSVTRESTIEILQKIGETVIIRDVSFDEVKQMKGIFTMGNAVGVLHVSEICMRKTIDDQGEIIDMNEIAVREKIFSIRDKIYKSRVGELDGFKDWVKKI